MDKVTNKEGNTRTDRAAIYGRFSDQKESPVDWTPHEDVTRQATKADYLLSTVFWSEKREGALVSGSRIPLREPEAERHKDRLVDFTLIVEI